MLIALVLIDLIFLGLAAYFWGQATKYRERSARLASLLRQKDEREAELAMIRWPGCEKVGRIEGYQGTLGKLDSSDPPKGGSGVPSKFQRCGLDRIREALRGCGVYEDDVGWMAQRIADKVFRQEEVKVGGTDE